MADIVVSGNTSGSVTLRAPDVSGTTVLTLPTTSGTIVTTGSAASLTTSGNLTFTGTGNRITGDFSNATIANRVALQTSTANSNTILSVLPTGTGSGTFTEYYQSGTDPANSSVLSVGLAGGAAVTRINSTITGTGTYLPLTFNTGGSERLRIDTSGDVGIGTSSPKSRLTVGGASSGQSLVFDNTGNNSGSRLAMNIAYSTAALGSTSYELIQSYTGLSGFDNQTDLRFFTANGSTPAERMRITSGGEVCIGKTTTGGSGAGLVLQNNGAYGGRIQFTRIDNALTQYHGEFYTNGGTTIGTISTSSTATAYNTSSDYRLKENVAPMTGALDIVAKLKPCTYTWKADGSAGQGFIAHELQAVVPDAVTGEKDAVDADGKPIYQGVDTSFLVATLTAAIQEQQAMIEELKASVEAQAAEIQALKGAK